MLFAGLLTAVFIGLIVVGVPIAFVIGIIALLGIWSIPGITIVTVPMKMFNGLNSFVLIAVPLFILAANIMNQGKISERLVDLAVALVGRIRGGLAHANVLVSMLFAGVSGAATADTAGLGKILIPNMIRTGYDDEMSVGVTAASSTIGIIIPPSIPMIIYAGLTNTSVAALFLAGIIPGILVGLGMMIVVFIVAVKKDIPRYELASFREVLRQVIGSLPALITPVFVISGIIFGWFTATEAAAFATIYALFIGFFVYRTIKIRDLPGILADTLKLSCLSIFALATASALGELLGYFQAGLIVQRYFTEYVDAPWIFMSVVIVFFLFVGTFMDSIPAMILFVPVILPSALAFGISPLHLGIVVIISVAIGLVTPPYGLCLLIASTIAKMPIEKSFRATVPYISVVLAVLMLVAFIPAITGLVVGLF